MTEISDNMNGQATAANPVLAAYVLPHPPVIVPGVNRGPHEAGKTTEAIGRLAVDFARIRPDTVVVISPHAPIFSDYLFMYGGSQLSGDLGRFGAPQAGLACDRDEKLQDELIRLLELEGIAGGELTTGQMKRYRLEDSLDHGVVVPLYFLAKAYPEFKLVAMSCSNLPLPELYRLGSLIREAALHLGRRIVLIASGDQSHKVNEESPYGSCPEGGQYDRMVADNLGRGDLPGLLSIDGQIRQRAAECGYRSLVIMSGAFAGQAILSEVLSYEAPYGIGYCVAAVKPDPSRPEPVGDALQEALTRLRQSEDGRQKTASAPVRLARMALETYIREHRRIRADEFPGSGDAAFLFHNRAGAFVSLKKFGELRGCIGTTAATTACLAEEILQNALSAGLRDPRFKPVSEVELADLSYSVDILGEPETVNDKRELDPSVYGVIVRSGSRSGLLLPDLEGVDTVDEQLAIACRKAGIQADEPYEIARFKVTRYH